MHELISLVLDRSFICSGAPLNKSRQFSPYLAPVFCFNLAQL